VRPCNKAAAAVGGSGGGGGPVEVGATLTARIPTSPRLRLRSGGERGMRRCGEWGCGSREPGAGRRAVRGLPVL